MQTPLISLGTSSLNLGQLLSVVVFVLLGIMFVVWSSGFLRRRLASRRVNADVTQMVSRAYLVLGFVVLAFMTMDFLQIPLAAFAFISGAVAIGAGRRGTRGVDRGLRARSRSDGHRTRHRRSRRRPAATDR